MSRCRGCRGLAPFTSIRQEEETTEAWDGMDADASAIDVVKLRLANDWRTCLRDQGAFPACSEIMAVVANWEITSPNHDSAILVLVPRVQFLIATCVENDQVRIMLVFCFPFPKDGITLVARHLVLAIVWVNQMIVRRPIG